MISSVRGPVLVVNLDHAVIEVGGVGLTVHATPSTLATLRTGEHVLLHTTLVVREDSLTLYGFADADARELFILLQSVSGVGPRLALATLAVLEPDVLRHAIADGAIATLTQVPGIGKKGAERLSLELRDKISMVSGKSTATPGQVPAQGADPASHVHSEVVDALVSLGFAAKQAEHAVAGVLANGAADADTATVLRSALNTLGRKR